MTDAADAASADALFFGRDITRAQAVSTLEDTLRGADDGEIYFESATSETLAFDDGRLKTASFDETCGFGLRCVAGTASGYAHSTELTAAALRRAAQAAGSARAGYAGSTALSEAPARSNRRYYGDGDPVHEIGFEAKAALLAEIDAYARARDPQVAQVSCSIACSRNLIEILRADGDRRSDSRPLFRLNVQVVMERDGRQESGSYGGGGRAGWVEGLSGDAWKHYVDEAIRQARLNLDAIPCPAGEMDVVLGPGWPGILLHEAIGHGLEGDFNRKGVSAFSGRIGERVAAPGVTVVDDGALPDRRGSLTIDDEGTPTSRTVLIEDGVLVGYMQDRLNARLMGTAPTGNGRRQSFAHIPMPRMTNTLMENGRDDPAELVSRVRRGIHAVNFAGGQVDITSGKFVFSCTEAYLVENGRVVAPVKGATLIGDGPTALTKVRGVGDDLMLDPGIGTCGKNGQGVPVGVGQPSLLIGGLTVGGAEV